MLKYSLHSIPGCRWLWEIYSKLLSHIDCHTISYAGSGFSSVWENHCTRIRSRCGLYSALRSWLVMYLVYIWQVLALNLCSDDVISTLYCPDKFLSLPYWVIYLTGRWDTVLSVKSSGLSEKWNTHSLYSWDRFNFPQAHIKWWVPRLQSRVIMESSNLELNFLKIL